MARFYPLYVRRSDGRTEIALKGNRKELNQPTEDQLDQKPDKDGVSDFYREVSVDEPKHLDWRRKLGGMLARELIDPKDLAGSDIGHIVVEFPHGYRLYEHVKRTEKDGKLEVKSKTHAAGGNDRQDAYLYGHPFGRRKRFRSPADFFPHLLWLCTDESGDPDNCSCKLCCPEELDGLIPGLKTANEKPARAEANIRPKATTGEPPQVVAAASPASGNKPSLAPAPPAPAPAPAPAPNPSAPSPTVLPPQRTQEQYVDSDYNGFIYRSGELVWFARGQRWGLGVIIRRWMSTPAQHHYRVQPLSYPFTHPPAIVKDSSLEMRPWLAWSVPKYTIEGLNTLSDPPRYETADWQGLINKQYGNGDLEVDGSILAAKTIDSSYTLIDKIGTSETEPGVVETRYDGIYLGAEKIWLRDPVRLQIGSGTDIMVIHAIVERKRVSNVTQHQQSVMFVGDVFSLSTVSHSDLNIPSLADPSKNPHVPQRLSEDLARRNSRSIPTHGRASYWRLVQTQSRLDLNDIKGRWYEATRLLPILLPNDYETAKNKGEIQESSLWMNSRGDCINNNRDPSLPRLPRENVRKATRRDALGSAVPPSTDIYNGLDAPTVDPALEGIRTTGGDDVNIDPRFESAEGANNARSGSNPLQLENANTGLDEFMNLDPIDEHAQMPNYDGQGGYY